MINRKKTSKLAFLPLALLITTVSCVPPANVPPAGDAPSSTATPTPDSSATATPDSGATATPNSGATATPDSGATATPGSTTPSANSSTQPTDATGDTSDIKDLATFNGKVKDPNGNDVEGAKVSARSLDPGVNWVGETQDTIGGAYVFRNAPVGTRLEITASKDGWTTRTRVEVLKSNLDGDPLANTFDFIGQYAIQDEPEIYEVIVNGLKATGVGAAGAANRIPTNDDGTTLSGISHDNLEVTLNFSEPVRRDDIQNYFRVVSQNFQVLNNSNFIIDENISGETFTWNDNDTSVTFKTNKAILSERTGNEARYKLEFTQAFRDKTDKEALVGKYIRFSPSTQGDHTVFSVKNDEQDPALSSLQAIDGGSNNDKLVLTFNEPFEVLNRSVVQAGLADPGAPNTAANQLWLASTNTGGAVPVDQTGANDATLLGYSNDGTANGFRVIYTVGRLINPAAAARKQLYPLNGYGWSDGVGLAPVAAKRSDTNHPLLATLNGNQVTLEFRSTAFSRDELVILSAGANISGQYNDRNNNVSFGIQPGLGQALGEITDPSGRRLSNSNSSTSANVTINDGQKVSRVSG